MSKEYFRVSANLKNLIWRELITNDNIAIFELVKNAYDAYASKVQIFFWKNKIVIADNWKWMSWSDIRYKRLFLWYSAKAIGDEDKNYSYRNRIKKRTFAWSKWVWRFACDRLWSKLTLLSRTEDKKDWSKLEVDWSSFEKDISNEFINIETSLVENFHEDDYKNFNTVLIISDLRTIWWPDEIINLKKSLAKLINPVDEDEFNIFITIDPEFELELENKYWIKKSKDFLKFKNEINSPVKNFIFESLDIKTTNISLEYFWKEWILNTTLEDRWDTIYSIKEKRVYEQFLWKDIDIKIKLFYMNPIAKSYFTKEMWIEPVNFWTIFVYKNWFRIYPFGEPWDDTFGIDRRKTQWYARYIWLRELFAKIDISSWDDYFKESTSRDWWFTDKNMVNELSNLVLDSLKRLEKYTVDILQWTYSKWDDTEYQRRDYKDEIEEMLLVFSKENEILESTFNDELIEWKIEETNSPIKKAIIKAKLLWDKENEKNLKETQKIIKQSIQQRNEAELEAVSANKNAKQKEKELWVAKRAIFFQKNLISSDVDSLMDHMHQICIRCLSITNDALSIKKLLSWENCKNNYEKIIKKLNNILNASEENRLIYHLVIWNANFKTDISKEYWDLVTFIKEYLKTAEEQYSVIHPLKINVEADGEFITKFIPLHIAIIFDNLINNSTKFSANEILVKMMVSNNILNIIFSDNWTWIDIPEEDIFTQSISSTNKWSWRWMSIIKEHLKEDFNWEINIYKGDKKVLWWASFILVFKK